MGSRGLQNGLTVKPISLEALQVLRLLATMNYTPRRMAKHLKKSRQTVYKHLRVLKKRGLIDENFEVKSGAYNLLHYGQRSNEYRINGVIVFFDLPGFVDKEKWKKNRGRVLSLKKFSHEPIILKNKAGVTDRAPQFFLSDRVRVRCHATGIMVYVPNIFASNGLNAELKLLDFIENVGLDLNKIFKVEFFRDNKLCVRILRYELAHLNDGVAREFRKENRKLFVSIDGVLRFQIDYSHSIDEAESMTPDHGLVDQENFQNYIKEILKNEKVLLPSQVLGLFQKQVKINAQRSDAELLLAKNIEAHVSLVKGIGESVFELKRVVKNLGKGSVVLKKRVFFVEPSQTKLGGLN